MPVTVKRCCGNCGRAAKHLQSVGNTMFCGRCVEKRSRRPCFVCATPTANRMRLCGACLEIHEAARNQKENG